MDLRQASMPLGWSTNKEDVQYLLQNSKLLENLHLSADTSRLRHHMQLKLKGLHEILSPSAGTLKVLALTIPFPYCLIPRDRRLAVLCEELEAMAGNNILEALQFVSFFTCP